MFFSVGEVIEIKTSPGLGRSLEAAMIVAKASECGQGRYQATKYRAGRLTLLAPTPIEAYELTLRSSEVLEELNQLFGSSLIKKLIIRTR